MIARSRAVARALRRVIEPDGIGVFQLNGAAAGQTVFHYHMHLIPRMHGEPLQIHSRTAGDPQHKSRNGTRLDSFRTPLKRARGLGSGKDGTGHWWWQRVTAVVLVGPVGATTQALHALLARQIPLFLVKYSGELIGRLVPSQGFHVSLRQAQYRRNDDQEFVANLARRIGTPDMNAAASEEPAA